MTSKFPNRDQIVGLDGGSAVTPSEGTAPATDFCADGFCNKNKFLAYEKPVLIAYGDVRDVTLGPTAGFGESGCTLDRRPGNPVSCP